MENHNNNNVAIVIPARYGSSRFPGKPLADLCGKPVIQRVCERASEISDNVYVATDDERIFDRVVSFGGKSVMTSTEHKSGTDRIIEALDNLGINPEIVVNIQGDEPFVSRRQIESLVACFDDQSVKIATVARKFNPVEGFEALFDSNKVKVTFDANGDALYFSRSIIPYVRNREWKEWTEATDYFIHLGMYAYRTDTLRRVASLPQSSLEKAESLEQLRWLQSGYRIRVALTDQASVGIDTPEDLEEAKIYFKQHIDR